MYLGKETATHSSILAWRIPWTEEPGRLQSMRSQRVRHDWVTNTHNLYTISLPQGPLFWSVKSHFPLQVQLLAHSALSSQSILCWRLLAAPPKPPSTFFQLCLYPGRLAYVNFMNRVILSLANANINKRKTQGGRRVKLKYVSPQFPTSQSPGLSVAKSHLSL